MAAQRNSYSAEFKARVALEALKGHKTINELVSHFGVHPTQINKWKNHLLTELPQMFSNRPDKREQDHEHEANITGQIDGSTLRHRNSFPRRSGRDGQSGSMTGAHQ